MIAPLQLVQQLVVELVFSFYSLVAVLIVISLVMVAAKLIFVIWREVFALLLY